MRVAQVHAAVETLLGVTVSKSSVNWCLSAGVGGNEAPFVRVERGRYAARRDERAPSLPMSCETLMIKGITDL